MTAHHKMYPAHNYRAFIQLKVASANFPSVANTFIAIQNGIKTRYRAVRFALVSRFQEYVYSYHAFVLEYKVLSQRQVEVIKCLIFTISSSVTQSFPRMLNMFYGPGSIYRGKS